MSRQALNDFYALVRENAELQSVLITSRGEAEFVEKATELARQHGFGVEKTDIEMQLRSARQSCELSEDQLDSVSGGIGGGWIPNFEDFQAA
jgi:predicted ribosomally synthesized peptide with nif11-like leader